jgi:uncharacterized protein (TIGR02271 family)
MARRGSSDIREGMDVFDVDGDKVGSVDEVAGSGAGYMKVKTGLLGLGGSWYIPFDAVREVRADGIYLSADKEDADRLGWNAPPTAAQQTGRVEATRETTRTGESREGVQLREEELRARKEPVQAGEVGIRKEVVTEQRTMDVPKTREEAVVERRPVERRPAEGDIQEGEEVRVPLREEQVRVEKQPVVTEEVTVGKQPVQETERVEGTVRREEPRVETEGDVDVRGDEQRRDRR